MTKFTELFTTPSDLSLTVCVDVNVKLSIYDPIRYWLEWLLCTSLNSVEVGLLSHLVIKSSVRPHLVRSGRLVFSSLRPVLEELDITEILLQSQLYPLNQRVDLTQDRCHCAPSLDLDLANRFHPILHHFHRLYHLFLHLQTSLDQSLSLHQVLDL